MNEQAYLGSRYYLEKRIGRGPSGTVYRAMDIERGEQVAVKVIDKQYARDPRFAIRFREHLKTLLGLSHDNLVVPYDYGYLDDRYYIASELVDGVDLGTYLAAHGPLSAAEATGITGQVCAALEEVHRRDLIHRGIKHTNIMLIQEGLFKLTDVWLDGVISETRISKTKR